MNVVTSEIHQDGLCFDMLQDGIFEEDDKNQPDSFDQCITSTFVAKVNNKELEFICNHFRSTEVDLVGLQVWRGALYLADYILAHPEEFTNKNVLELASGTGITSVVSACYAKSVMATDISRGKILDTIRENFESNKRHYPRCDTKVEELDFMKLSEWKERLKDVIPKIDVILCADVVYDKSITDSFFQTLSTLMTMNPKLTVFIAVEKRVHVNCEGKEIAPNFQHFLKNLSRFEENNKSNFKIKKLQPTFKQFFDCYQRVNQLNLWYIIPMS